MPKKTYIFVRARVDKIFISLKTSNILKLQVANNILKQELSCCSNPCNVIFSSFKIDFYLMDFNPLRITVNLTVCLTLISFVTAKTHC